MEDFNGLQELGSKKIAAKTHIPIAHVEMILNREFESFQKPQFFGFISIMEREYKIDLSSIKQEYLFSRAEEEISQETTIDISETSSKLIEGVKGSVNNKQVVYGVLGGVIVLLLVTLVTMVDFSSDEDEKIEINNTAIDQAKKNLYIEPVAVANVEEMMHENNVESAEHGQDRQEANVSTDKTKPAKKSKAVQKAAKKISISEPVSGNEPVMPLYLRIIPKGKLWLGIIDAETHRRSVETITKPLILDAEKSWLIVTGYGHLDMDCGDTTTKHRIDHKLLFLYEGGVCQLIDKEEFKARNRGKLW